MKKQKIETIGSWWWQKKKTAQQCNFLHFVSIIMWLYCLWCCTNANCSILFFFGRFFMIYLSCTQSAGAVLGWGWGETLVEFIGSHVHNVHTFVHCGRKPVCLERNNADPRRARKPHTLVEWTSDSSSRPPCNQLSGLDVSDVEPINPSACYITFVSVKEHCVTNDTLVSPYFVQRKVESSCRPQCQIAWRGR